MFFRIYLSIILLSTTFYFAHAAEMRPELVLQSGHTGSIRAVAISPDGKWLVSGGNDSTLKIWDLKSGILLRTLYGHNGKISGLAVSPDSHFIASSADDGTARLWDVTGGQEVRDLSGHTGNITSVAFSNGGQQVLTASTDAIKIWETSTGRELRTIPISEKEESGRTILSQDGRLYTLGGANQDPGGGFMGFGGKDVFRPLRVMEVASGHELLNIKTDAQNPYATYVISPDSRFLARRSSEFQKNQDVDSIRVYDLSNGKEFANFSIPGEGGAQGTGPLAISAGGKWLAAQGALNESLQQSILIFDLSTKQMIRELKPSGMFAPSVNMDVMTVVSNPFAFSPDAKILAYGGSTSIQLWDTNTGQTLHQLRTSLKAGASTGSVMDEAMQEEAQKRGYSLDQAVEMKQEVSGMMETLADPDNPLSQMMNMGTKMAGMRGADARSYSDKRIQISPNGRWLITENKDEIRIWDIVSGSLQQQKTYMRVPVTFSRDGRFIALMEFDPIKAGSDTTLENKTQDLVVRDLNTWSLLSKTTFTGKVQPEELSFAPDGSWLAIKISNEVRIVDPKTGSILRNIPVGEGSDKNVFDPSGHYLAMAGKESSSSNPYDQLNAMIQSGQTMNTKNMKDAKKQAEQMQKQMMKTFGQQMNKAPQPTQYKIKIFDLQSGSQIQTVALETRPQENLQIGASFLPGADAETHQIIFSPDGVLIGVETTEQQYPVVKIYETTSVRPLATIRISNQQIQPPTENNFAERMFQKRLRPVFVFSPDHSKIAIGSQEGSYSVKLYNTSGGNLITTLPQNNRVDAIAFHPNGRFLVSIIRDGSRTVWDLSKNTIRATLIEFPGIYFSTEWLVATPDGLFDGSPPAWGQIQWRLSQNLFDLSPVETFFNEFYYPGLLSEIFNANPPVAPRNLSQIDRRQPSIQLQGDGNGDTREIKIRVEVKEAPADAQHAAGSGAKDVRLFRNGVLVKVWRGDVLQGQPSKVLETQVPIVAGDNRFVAYAFNHENVKSKDTAWRVTGAGSLKRKGTAYIVAIGINQYENAGFNLKYAVADARAFAENLSAAQNHLAHFEKVQVVSLFDQDATKAGIVALLKAFGEGGNASKNILPVQPEDALFVYFAGHGTAEKSHFYMVPHDLGYTGDRDNMSDAAYQEVLKHAISDEELETLLENVGTGQTLLVIDACNSGQALESEEKRRGPMNSKGLAQLAYEKGMYVLAAAQGYQAALEAARLGHGYLTYALVEEGIKTASADQEPKDGEVVVREWLDFAAARVPEMQSEKMQEARLLKHEVAFVDGEDKIQDLQQRTVQQPRVFYRREMEINPLIILKP